MPKMCIWSFIFCCAMPMMLLAESGNWDAEAVKSMSKAERLAYQQAYKVEFEAAARERGWTPDESSASQETGRRVQPPSKLALGSIRYHSGMLLMGGLDGRMVGNRFNFALNPAGTAIGPVCMSGSITMATFEMLGVSGANVFVSFFDQLSGTVANGVTSFQVPANTGFNQVTFTPIGYSGSSFLAGVWKFGGDIPAVATGTVGGQGYHGISINDIAGTGFTTFSLFNAAFGVSGDVLTPVELLNFVVE